MSLKHTPAAMVAAGRAQIEPKLEVPNIEMMDTSPIHDSIVMDEIYSHPFKMVNRQPPSDHLSELLMDINSKVKSVPQVPLISSHSSPMYGKMSPPSMNIPNQKPSPLNTPKPTITAAKPATSKMSDPYMFTPGPHIAPDCTEGTACGRLVKYTRMRNLPMPEFKNFNKPDLRTGIKFFLSRVKIGDFNFSSFQLESSNLKDAQEYVAKLALDELHRRLDSVDSAVLPHTNNETIIIDRVAEIVNPHVTGLKASYVESQYKTLHREILPFNWIDIIENMSLLSVEKLVGGLFVYPASDENAKAAMVTHLPELVLPLSNTWNVFITVVSTPNRIYFRIIHDDYDGRFAVMSENMDAIYSSEESKKHPVEIIREGNYYAAHIESKWFRVKAMAPVADGKVDVLLIDVGEVDEISKDLIYPLDEQLTKLPAQAVRCGLTNLEEYCNNTYISEIIDDLISERTLVAKVDSRNPRLQLTLHDTCTDEDINVNELILQKIKHELTPPKIPAPLRKRLSAEKIKLIDGLKSSPSKSSATRQLSKHNLSGMLMNYWESELASKCVKREKNSLTPVRLTSVLEDGQAYVQLVSDSLAVMEEHLEKANEELRENEDLYVIKDAKELVGAKMCLVKYIDDGKWHRGAVQKLVPDTNEAQVLYVDYGNLEIVSFDRIADCQRISSILSEIPPQAIRVELVKPTQEIFTERIIDFLMTLTLPKTADDNPQPFIMKVVEDRNVPYVELFVRLSGDKEIHSVNDLIGTCFQEYRGKNFKMVTISKELDEKFRPIPDFPLPQPTVEFYVFVYMVSNPHEFFVQPHDFRPRLKELMKLMNEFYSVEAPAVNIETLSKGQVYAVKCEDNMWYRGVCHQIFESMNSISVKLVDYGNIISVKFQDIAHLLPCFRELPCLAIKAELAGISPINRDWDITNCIRFKDLVYEKVLTSFVVDVGAEKTSMVLFDSSMGNEVDIGNQLVKEGHAIDITKRL